MGRGTAEMPERLPLRPLSAPPGYQELALRALRHQWPDAVDVPDGDPARFVLVLKMDDGAATWSQFYSEPRLIAGQIVALYRMPWQLLGALDLDRDPRESAHHLELRMEVNTVAGLSAGTDPGPEARRAHADALAAVYRSGGTEIHEAQPFEGPERFMLVTARERPLPHLDLTYWLTRPDLETRVGMLVEEEVRFIAAHDLWRADGGPLAMRAATVLGLDDDIIRVEEAA